MEKNCFIIGVSDIFFSFILSSFANVYLFRKFAKLTTLPEPEKIRPPLLPRFFVQTGSAKRKIGHFFVHLALLSRQTVDGTQCRDHNLIA